MTTFDTVSTIIKFYNAHATFRPAHPHTALLLLTEARALFVVLCFNHSDLARAKQELIMARPSLHNFAAF